MSIKEAKKLLKLWQPVITVPVSMLETAEARHKTHDELKEYAKQLNNLTGKYVFVNADCNVDSPIINWPLKTYSQEVVLNWK